MTLEVRLTSGTVTAEVVKVNPRSCWVRLPAGNIISRKAGRDYDPRVIQRPDGWTGVWPLTVIGRAA